MASWHGKSRRYSRTHAKQKRHKPCAGSATTMRSHRVKYVNMDAVIVQKVREQ